MVNRGKGFIAVKIVDEGHYTVIELLGGEAELGDVISGDLNTHGGETLRNETRGEDLDCFIQAIQATPKAAYDLMR